MPTQDDRIALLQGALDLLILRILSTGHEHGQGIARAIQQISDEVLLVDHGSLYPALQRLEAKGWIAAAWGTSENNRRARFYAITATGRRHLSAEADNWAKTVAIVNRLLATD